MLHKLAKFHYQTVFTFHVSCLGIDDVMKFEYLKS